jgi:hypothetical protein
MQRILKTHTLLAHDTPVLTIALITPTAALCNVYVISIRA